MLYSLKAGDMPGEHHQKDADSNRYYSELERPAPPAFAISTCERCGSALISVEGASLELPIGSVLENIDFSVEKGEIVTIIGPNGAGKSTLLKLIIGLIASSSGIVARSPDLKIGYLPQRISLNPNMPITVDRFLRLCCRAPDGNSMKVREITGIRGLASRQMRALSQGQLQRVLLAKALLGSPDLLVLDEPTQSLDRNGIRDFYRIIRDVRADTGCAVLKTSHELDILIAYADRVVCMNKRIVCQGPPGKVSKSPEFLSMFGGGVDGLLAILPAAEKLPSAA